MEEFRLDDFLARTWTHKALVELGKENLERIIPLLRKQESSDSHNIGYVRDSLDILKGKTEKTLAEAADVAIDYAALMSTLPVPGGSSTRLEGYGYTYGHTTFRQCGGCEHACWWGQDVGCRFFSHLDRSMAGAPYDSPCRLRKPGETERIIKGLEEKIGGELKQQNAGRQTIRDWIDRLLAAKREAKSQPQLPVFRNKTFFLFGDRVLVWTGFPAFGKQQNKWAPATVLHVEKNLAVTLDRPMLPPNAYARKDYIKKEWVQILWHIHLASPFALRSEDFATLAQLPNDNALKKLWIESAEGWHVEDPASQTYGHSEPDPKMFAESLHPSFLLEISESGKRMMSGNEAASLLGFSTQPSSAEAIVTAYRLLKKTTAMPEVRLEQAKSTLLVRLYGHTKDH